MLEEKIIRTISIDKLFLDESNPRFTTPVTNQNDAITALLRDSYTKMLNLAKDIAQEGLNPSEIPIAVSENDRLVIIEGNRRIACLKILLDTSLVKDASLELDDKLMKKFSEVIKDRSIPTEIDVYIAPNRDSARHWIELKHTGGNDGVGVLEWASWQTNNFRRKRGSTTDKAIIFCKAVLDIYPNDNQLINDVNSVRYNKLTTLARLISDPDVRQNFGFDIKKDQVIFDYSSNDVLGGIKKIFEDLAGNVTVTNLKQKEHRAEYISNRHKFLPDRSRRLAVPETVWDDEEQTTHIQADNKYKRDLLDVVPSPKGEEHEGHKSIANKPYHSSSREKFIFHKLNLMNVNSRIKKFMFSSQKVDIEKYPQIAAVLIRILVELVITEGIEKGVIKNCNEGTRLKQKIRHALLALDPNCEHTGKRQKELEMAWIRTQDSSTNGIAVQSMNAFVHSIYGDPTVEDVRILSDTFRPVLEGIDKLLNLREDG